MAKLNQIIAIEKGVKSRSYAAVSELHKTIQKAELFTGFSKTYQKKDDESEELPSEKKRVQFVAEDLLKEAEKNLAEYFDVTARKDWTNCEAKASVRVGTTTVIEDAPVTYLLFLEKQLTDIRTFIGTLPVLDEGDDWTLDENSAVYKTAPLQTHRTKKTVRPIVLYQATEQHPAQTQLITEDVIAGFWNTIKQSGAMPKPRKEVLLSRVEKLLQAVKEAREEANGYEEVTAPKIGEAIFGFLLAK